MNAGKAECGGKVRDEMSVPEVLGVVAHEDRLYPLLHHGREDAAVLGFLNRRAEWWSNKGDVCRPSQSFHRLSVQALPSGLGGQVAHALYAWVDLLQQFQSLPNDLYSGVQADPCHVTARTCEAINQPMTHRVSGYPHNGYGTGRL